MMTSEDSDIQERIAAAKRAVEAARREVIEHNTQLRLVKEELTRLMEELKVTYGLDSVDEALAKLDAIEAKIQEKLTELEQW
jgi:DNA-binding FrmR family transcriptional regulator